MALPVSDPNQSWPPQNMTTIFAHMAQWSAWYTNDIAKLQEAYGGGVSADSTGFFASDTGGFKPTIGQRFQRWFVGQRPMGPNRNTKLPVPMGALICQATSDLLYADPPTFTVAVDVDGDGDGAPNSPASNATQERLNELADEGMYSVLAQATEIAAALGGSFVRVAWDKSVVAERPFLDLVDADMALPEFRWGRLVAVTFWQVVARDGKKVWRHLERHELGLTGNGLILHGLYEGEDDKLGYRVGLDARPETAGLNVSVNGLAPGVVDSASPGLCVEYLPNQGPQRLWRTDMIGRNLGRSSIDGIEHLLDQLAETLSDWMRARRSAKARVFYDATLLSNPGPGNGAVADMDQEVYVGAKNPVQGPNVKMSDKIEVVQPTFNVSEYEKTYATLVEQIIELSGFALQTFGMQQGSSASRDTTATEVEARERMTFLTRGRLIRTQVPHLSRIVQKLLAVDKAIFGTPNVVAPIIVDFPDGVQESMLKRSQTVLAGFQSESMSRDERVRILHPEWNDDMWNVEADKLETEFAAPITDPNQLPPEVPAGPDNSGGDESFI